MTPVYGLWTVLSLLPIYQLTSRPADIWTGSPFNEFTRVRRRCIRVEMVLSISSREVSGSGLVLDR